MPLEFFQHSFGVAGETGSLTLTLRRAADQTQPVVSVLSQIEPHRSRTNRPSAIASGRRGFYAGNPTPAYSPGQREHVEKRGVVILYPGSKNVRLPRRGGDFVAVQQGNDA